MIEGAVIHVAGRGRGGPPWGGAAWWREKRRGAEDCRPPWRETGAGTLCQRVARCQAPGADRSDGTMSRGKRRCGHIGSGDLRAGGRVRGIADALFRWRRCADPRYLSRCWREGGGGAGAGCRGSRAWSAW